MFLYNELGKYVSKNKDDVAVYAIKKYIDNSIKDKHEDGGYILYDSEKYYYTIEKRIKSSTHIRLGTYKNLYGYKVVGYWHTHPFGDKKYLSEAFSGADIATVYKANWSDAYVGTYGGKILHYNINISNSIPYENQLYEIYSSLIVVEHTEVVGYWR